MAGTDIVSDIEFRQAELAEPGFYKLCLTILDQSSVQNLKPSK
jgi:hypothetical protein